MIWAYCAGCKFQIEGAGGDVEGLAVMVVGDGNEFNGEMMKAVGAREPGNRVHVRSVINPIAFYGTGQFVG